jgi:putative FmdB family regulatory protein
LVPTYVYECESCEHRFEERQGFHDDPLTDCRLCDGRVRRVFMPAPIIFKGSGFYVTDSRPAGSGGGVVSPPSGESNGSAAADGKDSTPAKSTSEGSSGGDSGGGSGGSGSGGTGAEGGGAESGGETKKKTTTGEPKGD